MVAQIDEEGEKGKDMYLQAVGSCKNKFSYNCCGCGKMAMHGNSLFRKTGETDEVHYTGPCFGFG